MSHFCVAVIVDEPTEEAVEKVLAPYDENIEVEPYLSETKAEIIERAKELKTRLENKIAENLDYELTSYNKELLACVTDDDFYNYMYDEDELHDEEGNLLSTYNPNSKWDWYTTGFMARFGVDGTFIKLKDIILENEDFDLKATEREWDLLTGQTEATKEEKENGFFTIWNPQYYFDRYGDKETYIKLKQIDYPYAFVDSDNWYEQGEMGWFACDNADKNSILAFVDAWVDYIRKSENSEKYLVFVDCHI